MLLGLLREMELTEFADMATRIDREGGYREEASFQSVGGTATFSIVLNPGGKAASVPAAPELKKEQEILQRSRTLLEEGKPLRDLELPAEDARRLRGFQFLSAKPLLLVINLDEADVPAVGASVERAAEKTGLSAFLAHAATRAVALCATIELEISRLEGADAAAFLADLGLSESGLDRVIRASYDLLGYMSFFTVGEDECRAWSIARGTPAQAGAGEIHSDIERGFIRAEVVAYDALVSRGSMAECRHHGEVRLEGKDYVVQDGDIINFRFAT